MSVYLCVYMLHPYVYTRHTPMCCSISLCVSIISLCVFVIHYVYVCRITMCMYVVYSCVYVSHPYVLLYISPSPCVSPSCVMSQAASKAAYDMYMYIHTQSYAISLCVSFIALGVFSCDIYIHTYIHNLM